MARPIRENARRRTSQPGAAADEPGEEGKRNRASSCDSDGDRVPPGAAQCADNDRAALHDRPADLENGVLEEELEAAVMFYLRGHA